MAESPPVRPQVLTRRPPAVGLETVYHRSRPRAPQGAAGVLVVAALLSKGLLPMTAGIAPPQSSLAPLTVKVALALLERPWASLMVAGRTCAPMAAAPPTVTLAE